MELIKNVRELREFLEYMPDDYEIKVLDNEHMNNTPAWLWVHNNTIIFDIEV